MLLKLYWCACSVCWITIYMHALHTILFTQFRLWTWILSLNCKKSVFDNLELCHIYPGMSKLFSTLMQWMGSPCLISLWLPSWMLSRLMLLKRRSCMPDKLPSIRYLFIMPGTKDKLKSKCLMRKYSNFLESFPHSWALPNKHRHAWEIDCQWEDWDMHECMRAWLDRVMELNN